MPNELAGRVHRLLVRNLRMAQDNERLRAENAHLRALLNGGMDGADGKERPVVGVQVSESATVPTHGTTAQDPDT